MKHPKIRIDHIPDEHLRGIGLVAASWAFMEGVTERIIWRTSRLNDNNGIALTTHMSVPARLDAMCAAIDTEFPDSEAHKKATKLSKKIKNTLAPRRNEIVHNRIVKMGALNIALRPTYRARGAVRKEIKPALLEDYENASRDILEVANDLRALLAEITKMSTQKHGAPPP